MLKQKRILPVLDSTVARRHSKKVLKRGEDQCWPWRGACRDDSYGIMAIHRVQFYAHRIAVVIATREDIPEGMTVDHKCRNKKCCNPAHLEIVTQAENVARHHAAVNPDVVCLRGHNYQRGKACPTCNRERQAEWKLANPEKAKAISHRYESKRAKTRWDWHKDSKWQQWPPDAIS